MLFRFIPFQTLRFENINLVDNSVLNQRNDFPTPYVHSHILKRMAGKWKFRHWFLQDGLHPAPETVEIQDRELTNKLIDAIRTLVNQL